MLEFSWWGPSAESGGKSTNVVQEILRNGWIPTGPSLRKFTSGKQARDHQYPFSTTPIAIQVVFLASAAPPKAMP
jgi:hypothetical protein